MISHAGEPREGGSLPQAPKYLLAAVLLTWEARQADNLNPSNQKTVYGQCLSVATSLNLTFVKTQLVL